jgi:peptidoglycan biosynthesis protein MviN/MurJ (putative lipid II flippase)
LAHENNFSQAYFANFAEACEKHSKAVHPLEKSVMNMISLVLLVFFLIRKS